MWTNASKLSDQQIEQELGEVAEKVRDAIANGAKIGELEARRFSLRAEQRFREQSK